MATYKPCVTLADLPTEVTQMVLARITCTEALSAAIRASPLLLQSFLGQREQILIKVIQSSLDPGIFMELLGFVHLPNLSNLNHVIGPPEVRPDISKRDLCYQHLLLRWHEHNRFTEEFLRQHYRRLDEGREPGAPQPFPIPTIKQPGDQEQVAEFRQAVNTVVGIFGSLRRHMPVEPVTHKTRVALAKIVASSENRGLPDVPLPFNFFRSPLTFVPTSTIPFTYPKKWLRLDPPVVAEKKRFLRALFETKLMESR